MPSVLHIDESASVAGPSSAFSPIPSSPIPRLTFPRTQT
jgi:hypothetical protein